MGILEQLCKEYEALQEELGKLRNEIVWYKVEIGRVQAVSVGSWVLQEKEEQIEELTRELQVTSNELAEVEIRLLEERKQCTSCGHTKQIKEGE
jgi:chromosome segregation ATPase|tara:strand:+ start:471 stop:752 length:282 start_codon:yes stop_codon:yes gene_type:complete